MSEQRREYFRVEFPLGFRPKLSIMGDSFDVLDISECGIRFLIGDDVNFIIGTHINGSIRFSDGEELVCKGVVLRKEFGSVAVHHDVPVPLARIRLEHLNLIRNFYSKYN